jgi:hypothetical protein
MNLQLLIDSIIRQTTVLIAQLATAQGVRRAAREPRQPGVSGPGK